MKLSVIEIGCFEQCSSKGRSDSVQLISVRSKVLRVKLPLHAMRACVGVVVPLLNFLTSAQGGDECSASLPSRCRQPPVPTEKEAGLVVFGTQERDLEIS